MTDERAPTRPRGGARTRRGSGRARGGGTTRGDVLSDTRKGEQLQEILEAHVEGCEPGERLPSERRLAEQYGVARMTIRGVLERLASQGLVHRAQGQGTFVSEPRVAQPATLTSFTEDMRARGRRPTSIVLAQEVVPAPKAVAVRLELAPRTPLVRIERVRRGDDQPVALERTHLPATRFPGLEDIDLTTASLYGTLASVYDCELTTSEQRIAAISLSPAEAHLLHTDPHTPALRIERVTRDRDGTAVEFVRSVYRGDRFELHTEQHRLLDVSGPRGSANMDDPGPAAP